jgi:molybdopterin-guanine dinucleotide biosynthesis protein A
MTSGAQAGSILVGLLVGGQGTRLGGVAKGKLKAPSSELSLVERLLLEIRAALPGAEIVLVGNASEYSTLGLETVEDQPPNVGPLGGLAGLLAHAQRLDAGHVLALACDLPRLDRSLISRLAREHSQASVVLVRQSDVRNPLIARYAVAPATAAVRQAFAKGKRSLQAVLDLLEPDVASLTLTPDQEVQLHDWDTPDDVRGGSA